MQLDGWGRDRWEGGGDTEGIAVKEGIGAPRKGVRVFISHFSVIIESLLIYKK